MTTRRFLMLAAAAPLGGAVLPVPGMVAGSPGMETGPPQPFSTIAFDERGSRVFARH